MGWVAGILLTLKMIGGPLFMFIGINREPMYILRRMICVYRFAAVQQERRSTIVLAALNISLPSFAVGVAISSSPRVYPSRLTTFPTTLESLWSTKGGTGPHYID
jgi:hypothetical protein